MCQVAAQPRQSGVAGGGAFLLSAGDAVCRALGAVAISLIGLANIAGTLTAGWLGKYYPKKYLLAMIYAGRTVVASDYGYSVMLPAFWLAVIWLVGVAAFWGDATPGCPAPAEHSAANLVAFLGYLRVYYPECASDLPEGLKAWSGLQTFLSYLLLFFLGLGLRQRFRLR